MKNAILFAAGFVLLMKGINYPKAEDSPID
jgi:hypothetical protein